MTTKPKEQPSAAASLVEDGLLTIEEVSDFLKISPRSVYNAMDKGDLPYTKLHLGGRRVPRKALIAFATKDLRNFQ